MNENFYFGEQVHFNSASMGLQMKAGRRCVDAYLSGLNDPSNHGMIVGSQHYEKALLQMSQFFGCSTENMGYVPSPSYALTTIFSGLSFSEQDEVISFDQEYSSNCLALQFFAKEKGFKLRLVESKEGVIDYGAVIESLHKGTRAVVLSSAQFLSGQMAPLLEFSKKCQDVEALLIVDGSQSVGLSPLSLTEIPLDALYGSSHKWLCGVTGGSYFYLSDQLKDKLGPLVHGGVSYEDSIGFATKGKGFAQEMQRFLPGTPSLIPLICMAENMSQLQTMDLALQFEKTKKVTDQAIARLKKSGIEPIGHDASSEWMSILSFKAPDQEAFRKKLESHNVLYSEREGYFRFAFHMYNSLEELEFL